MLPLVFTILFPSTTLTIKLRPNPFFHHTKIQKYPLCFYVNIAFFCTDCTVGEPNVNADAFVSSFFLIAFAHHTLHILLSFLLRFYNPKLLLGLFCRVFWPHILETFIYMYMSVFLQDILWQEKQSKTPLQYKCGFEFLSFFWTFKRTEHRKNTTHEFYVKNLFPLNKYVHNPLRIFYALFEK